MAAYLFGIGLVLSHVGFLFLSTCGDDNGEDSPTRRTSPQTFEVQLSFTPTVEGFVIGNQSDFGDFVSVSITATSEDRFIGRNVDISEFIDGSYNFTGLDDQSNWTFAIIGTLSDGSERDLGIDFIWEENRADHESGGIRAGTNTDGDGRADSVDNDDDNDGILDMTETFMVGGRDCRLYRDCDDDGIGDSEGDRCPYNETGWTSNGSSDNDGDGCRDESEDIDDDNDGLNDREDLCSAGETDWESNDFSDNDGDGCRDAGEDTDDDNDGLDDDNPIEQQNNSAGVSCSLLADCDGDTVKDINEAAVNCVIETDCDNDGLDDDNPIEQQNNSAGVSCSLLADCDNDTIGDNEGDACSAGETGWTSNPSSDNDGDGCRDETEDDDDDNDKVMDGEDIDRDGDGLIEIGTPAELNSVRYALDGDGRRLLAGAELNISGCGGGDGIRSCDGYELVANISLAAYSDGKGWQPLGEGPLNFEGECQGAAFNGTFEGNGFMISDLNISRSGEDCVGLFGHIAENSEIRNLRLSAEAVIGRNIVGGLAGYGEFARVHSSSVEVGEVSGRQNVGGLVGYGEFARIASSSVVAGKVRGTNDWIGGLVGWGDSAQIHSSSVVVGEVMGVQAVGGLVGLGDSAQIHYSSVVVGEVRGDSLIGGLVGWGLSVRIDSSSVVASKVGGRSTVGGLVGNGEGALVHSSSVVAAEVSGSKSIPLSYVGGLVGDGRFAQIHSSSVVVAEVSGRRQNVGGLVGFFDFGDIAYSYVVSDTPMLAGAGSRVTDVASYWDSDVNGINSGNTGEAKTSDELRMPTDYERIYADWDNATNIFNNGEDVPLAVWCDEDHSGSITGDEKTDDNLIWDFGGTDEYPAIRCTPLAIDNWRSWWFLNRTSAKPQLNQTRLDESLP